MLKNISIKSQLMLAIGVLSALLVVVGLSGLWGMSKANDGMRAIYERQTVPAIKLGDLRVKILHIRNATVTAISFKNEAAVQQEEIEQDVIGIKAIWAEYTATNLPPGERKLADEFSGELERCLDKGLNPEIELQRTRNWADAEHFYWETMRPLCKPLSDRANALLQFQVDIAKSAYDDSLERYKTTRTLALSLISAGIALAGLLGFLFVRSIGRGLQSAIEFADKIAAGNLSGNVNIPNNNEISKLLEAMQVMQDKLAHRTAQLVASNKELEEFSYSMSHDMRTPLRALDGFSKILLDEYGASLDDEGKRLLGVLRDSAQRMGQLVDDILFFVNMGRRRIVYSSVDIAELASEIFAELQVAAPPRRLRLAIGALPPALGDRDMMRVVLQSLLSNSVKFSKADDETLIEVDGTAKQDENVYSVRDHGIGFDMRYADKLFKVFERVHPTGRYEGSGIGLALVKRIVTRHGGRVWAEGKVNEGATIYFALPTTEVDQVDGSRNLAGGSHLDRRMLGHPRVE